MPPLLPLLLLTLYLADSLTAPASPTPCPDSGVKALLKRLDILEKLVRDLKGRCNSPCCASVQTGADDPSSHSSPPCPQTPDSCPGGCGGDSQGICVDGQCQCKDGYMGDQCQLQTCPEDCNDQGRCVKGQCICFDGYAGPNCGSRSCLNDCQNQGRCEDGECICNTGYAGVDCSTRICPLCRNRGKCVGGICVCAPGFTGVDCGSRSCPKRCLNNGRCENGVCVCPPGFSGPVCGSRTCPNNCNGRGLCEDGACVCDSGFTGLDCSSRTCPNDCNDQGTCKDGVCICDSGFFGPDCGSRNCPEDCSEQGQCVSGVCVCDPGFVGPDCGTRVCSPECEKRGRCEEGECICDPGYAGQDCEIRTCPADCNKQGRCNDGNCICDSGYTGLDCGSRTCPNNCNKRGRCEDGVCICKLGFSGVDCGSKACPKDCSGHGQCVNGRCVCDAGFSGPICGTLTCPAGCVKHGRCVRGVCVCSPGYTGPDCSSKLCPKSCNNRGRCEDGACLCDSGYGGLDCGSRTCPNDCHNQGQCNDGVCVCSSGYGGVDCGTRTCPNDCNNQGRCDDGQCICYSGFTGLDCGDQTCPNNCNNQGQCADGQCICYSGFVGLDCSSRTCPNDCNNRGQCDDGECICYSGFTGLDCGSRTCPNDCNNRGQCDDGECICDSGFTGLDCGSRTCPNDCTDRGQCDNGKCICDSGFTDLDCGSRTCPNDCNNQGRCDDGECICDSGYIGMDCGSRTCLNNCNDQGVCDDGTCICDSGFAGEDCGSRTCPNNCHNHGSCADGKCICDPGYMDVDCSSRDCPENCNNQGYCEDGVCVCDSGYSGVACESRVCPDNCKNRGRCVEGICVCQPGFIGPNCGSKSCPKNCSDNGQCLNGKCVCNLGFSGPVCGARVCPSNCGDNGRCVKGVCICKKGFGGVDCSQEIIEVSAVTGLRVTSQEETAVTVEWDRPQSTPDTYEITFKAKKENGMLSNTVDGSLNSYRQTGLAPGEEYVVTIHPRKGQTVAPEVSVIATTRIETPHGLQVTDITSSSFLLRWDRPQSPPNLYIVTLVAPSGKERKLRVPGRGNRVRITGLEEGTLYRLNLRAERGQEHSEGAETTATTAMEPTTSQVLVTVPPTEEVTTSKPTTVVTKRPQGPIWGALQVRDVTSDSVTLVWKARPGTFESFLVRYEDVTDSIRPQETSVPGDQREVTLTGLNQNTRYSVSVYGVRNGKLSRPLKEEVTTESSSDRGTPPRLSPLSVTEVQTDSFLVSWEPLDGDFDAFMLMYGPPDGPVQEMTLRGDQTSIRLTGLEIAVNYTVKLRGVWGERHSEPEIAHVLTVKPQPPQLESLSISDVRSDSILLSWDVQGGEFDSFLLAYNDAEGNPQKLSLEGDLRTIPVKDLKPAKKYKFSLYGIFGGKRGKAVTAETITKKRLPPRLESISVSDARTDSVDLSWVVENGDFDSFLLTYRDAEGKPTETILDGDERTVTVTDLRPGKKYKFVLYGILGGKRGKAVIAEISTAPLPPTPSATRLVDLQASDIGRESVKLSWTVKGDPPFEWIVVQFLEHEGGVRELQVPGGDTSTVVLGLLPAKKYEFTVYGVQGEKRSKPLITEVMTAYPEHTGKPTSSVLDELFLYSRGPHSLLVSWEAPLGYFENFRVRYGPQGHEGSMDEVVVDGTARTLLLTSLLPDTLYNVTLFGVREGNAKDKKEDTGRTGPLELQSPRDLKFTDIKQKSVIVSWDPPNPETTTFKVSYQPADGGEPESVSVVGTSTPLTGLNPGTRYEVTVVTVRGFEESQPLTGYTTTVGGGPRSLRAHDVTEESALLRWEAPLGPVDKYIVIYRAENVPEVTVDVPGDRTELLISGLLPHTEYTASVQSTQGSKTSPPTSTSFTTSDDTPRDLSASQITARSALLTWTAPESLPDGYLLTYQTPEGQMQEITLLPTLSTFILTELTPLTLYRVQLRALHGRGSSAPISTSFTTGRVRYPFPRDCWEQRQNGDRKSGIFNIYMGGSRDEPMPVYCDMETDGGGWIVFQRRMDGSINFFRDWNEYRKGFGNLTSEFWLGNTALHRLSSIAPFELRIDLRAGEESAYAMYDDFRVEAENQYFKLRLGQYRGNAGDSMSYHNNMIFSTRDRDAQKRILPCAMSYRGAWWYRNCHYANLNGMYANNKDHQGINWFTWKGFEFSIPFTEMKMRPRGVGNRQRF
ncbi:tenascin-X isoform 3-T3 [Discoglossus pictus]